MEKGVRAAGGCCGTTPGHIAALVSLAKELPVRQSHENPAIKWIYDNYLGEPNSHLAHKLLHTTYRNRQDLLR